MVWSYIHETVPDLCSLEITFPEALRSSAFYEPGNGFGYSSQVQSSPLFSAVCPSDPEKADFFYVHAYIYHSYTLKDYDDPGRGRYRTDVNDLETVHRNYILYSNSPCADQRPKP